VTFEQCLDVGARQVVDIDVPRRAIGGLTLADGIHIMIIVFL